VRSTRARLTGGTFAGCATPVAVGEGVLVVTGESVAAALAVGAGDVSSGRVCGALTHPPASATPRSATIDRGALLMFQTKRA